MLSKEKYTEYKRRFANMRLSTMEKSILDYKMVEDYNYSPDKSLSILLKQDNREQLIWNERFLSFESIYDDLELSNKVNRDFFQYFRFMFSDEWNEYEN